MMVGDGAHLEVDQVMRTNGEQVRGPGNLKLLDLGRAPYVSYGVKYIDLVSLGAHLEVEVEPSDGVAVPEHPIINELWLNLFVLSNLIGI